MSEATWNNRIVGHGTEAPDQLLANPQNWRVHPKRQQTALTQVLDKVGWVTSVIVNQRTGHVVDGHLRVGLAISRGEDEIPVDYVDLDESEEALVLASLDPLSTLATTDNAQLMSLLSEVGTEGALEDLLHRTAGMELGESGTFTQEQIEERQDELEHQFGEASRSAQARYREVICPSCGNEFAVETQ